MLELPEPLAAILDGEEDDGEGLLPGEVFWRDHYMWLNECGYLLRPRYRPDWVPSWTKTKKWPESCEDGLLQLDSDLMDGERNSDGKVVVFKKISKSRHPYEEEIGRFLSSKPLASDPYNHSVPIIDVLQVPDDDDLTILVMPLLRKFNDPPFDTIGEVLEFFRQIFEGLQFMHHHLVAHRDCMVLNYMMDPTALYPRHFHPVETDRSRDFKSKAKHYRRTSHPVSYVIIDFGISRRYQSSEMPPLEPPILGGDKSAPEFKKSAEPCNPFPTDVYYVGNFIRTCFLEVYHGLEFMRPFVMDMVQDDPEKRPDMDAVVDRYAELLTSRRTRSLRGRLAKKRENPVAGIFRRVSHSIRTCIYIARGYNPLPTPRAL